MGIEIFNEKSKELTYDKYEEKKKKLVYEDPRGASKQSESGCCS